MYAHTLRRQLQPDSVIISSLERLRSQSQDQSQSDDVSCLFGCTQSSLHVSSSKRRLVVGRLIYTEAGDRIDCSKMGFSGVSIPSNLDHVGDLESDALFILLVQKGSAFCRLAENRFYNRFPCIIITAKGLPDVATRSFLRRLKIEFKLPVLALVNNDPFGLEILSVYMCGSKNDNTNLTIPDVKWLGLRPSDLYKYQFSQPCQLPMTDQEVKAVKDLLEEDFVKRNKGWLMELEMMVKTRRKAETEALCSFGLQYLTEVYLPLKLQQQDWL